MIHSARPTVPPGAIVIFTWNCFVLWYFEKWQRTYRRTTVGRPRGSFMRHVCTTVHYSCTSCLDILDIAWWVKFLVLPSQETTISLNCIEVSQVYWSTWPNQSHSRCCSLFSHMSSVCTSVRPSFIDRYWQECGSVRGDHWWQLSFTRYQEYCMEFYIYLPKSWLKSSINQTWANGRVRQDVRLQEVQISSSFRALENMKTLPGSVSPPLPNLNDPGLEVSLGVLNWKARFPPLIVLQLNIIVHNSWYFVYGVFCGVVSFVVSCF